MLFSPSSVTSTGPHTCDLDSVHVNDATSAPLSVSSIWGYRSALVDVYRAKLIELDTQLDTELRRVLDGYEKTVNSLKKSGLMKINEILMWNLMSRSESIDSIMLQHMEWTEDCLSIEEQGHKGDQKGVEKFGKHVLRKGSSSYALGQVYGPTTVSVYLRVGQSLADTQVIHVVYKPPFPFYWLLSFTTNRIYDKSCPRSATLLAIGESPVSGMKATRIPPHLAVAKKVSELQEQLAAIGSEMEILKTTMTNSIPNEVASKVPQHHMRHSRVRIVMEFMQKFAEEPGVLPTGFTKISVLDLPTADKTFSTLFDTMLTKLYRETPKRAEELSCGTIYNRISRCSNWDLIPITNTGIIYISCTCSELNFKNMGYEVQYEI
ncbi:hypothetical protein GQ600_9338 [Phytophthora cactorum]|nr:hypothetical protein GQ600_9338 [Phytophthora cactorum]